MEKPIVYVSVSGGIAETFIFGDQSAVDVVVIDWDELDPKSWNDSDDPYIRESIEFAQKNAALLPEPDRTGVLKDLDDLAQKWAEDPQINPVEPV